MSEFPAAAQLRETSPSRRSYQHIPGEPPSLIAGPLFISLPVFEKTFPISCAPSPRYTIRARTHRPRRAAPPSLLHRAKSSSSLPLFARPLTVCLREDHPIVFSPSSENITLQPRGRVGCDVGDTAVPRPPPHPSPFSGIRHTVDFFTSHVTDS